jgi:four helix bundle protein
MAESVERYFLKVIGTMNESLKTFEDLDCWKACREIRVFIARKICKALPKDERYRMGNQILRAARSTTAKIAEGYGHFHYLDNAKFCSNARRSAWEVMDHIMTIEDEELAPTRLTSEAKQIITKAVAPLNGCISYLRRTASKKPAIDGGTPTP